MPGRYKTTPYLYHNDPPRVVETQEERDAKVQAFLDAGGEIEQVPAGYQAVDWGKAARPGQPMKKNTE